MSKEGKLFEADMENSCKKQSIFYHRIKDVYVPPDLRARIRVPKNKYDSFMFYKGYLFPTEFKSTKQKSISFDEKIIKEHQIESLKEASEFEFMIPGFIFNFRDSDNFTCFIHINDFLIYKETSEGKRSDMQYENKINKNSIPVNICKEIGYEIPNGKKKVHYFYDVKKLLNKLIQA